MTPGRAAYEKWRDGNPGLNWIALSELDQMLWENIATAAIERQRVICCPLCEGAIDQNECPHSNVVV